MKCKCGAICGSFYGAYCFYCGALLHPEELGGENEKAQAEARALDALEEAETREGDSDS